MGLAFRNAADDGSLDLGLILTGFSAHYTAAPPVPTRCFFLFFFYFMSAADWVLTGACHPMLCRCASSGVGGDDKADPPPQDDSRYHRVSIRGSPFGVGARQAACLVVLVDTLCSSTQAQCDILLQPEIGIRAVYGNFDIVLGTISRDAAPCAPCDMLGTPCMLGTLTRRVTCSTYCLFSVVLILVLAIRCHARPCMTHPIHAPMGSSGCAVAGWALASSSAPPRIMGLLPGLT